MKTSRTIAAALVLLVVGSVLAFSGQAAPGTQAKKPESKPPAKASMPKEIAAVIQEGLATRQGRQDIPFSPFKQLTLFAKGGLFPVFLFKAKNADLGYAPSASGSGEMETTFNVYYQFYRNAEDGTQTPFFGGKSLTALKTDGQGYDPEKEDWYSFGTALEVGKYTLAIVLTTPDMKKISVAYGDITLPGPEAYQTALFATEPVLLKSMDQVEPDARPTIHRACFYYGAAQVRAYVMDPVPQGGALDIIFYVFGAAAKEPAAERPVNDLEVNYQVQGQDGKTVVRWAPQSYDAFAINQQLPLEQTVQKIDEKGTVLSQEKKPLASGTYTLVIEITDKISGRKGETKVGFKVQ
jgi:hypothetical protein